jgi:hypothetical protein
MNLQEITSETIIATVGIVAIVAVVVYKVVESIINIKRV